MRLYNENLTRIKRLSHRNGKALASANFALSAGFGSTASVAVASGSTDSAFQITITSAGTGQGASPTCTLTFADGSWTASQNVWQDLGSCTPLVIAQRNGGDQPSVDFTWAATPTTVVLTFAGTPVAGETYTVGVRCVA